MTRKELALLEMIKRGGTINERRIACEKLFLITGKNYSYLLPKEEVKKPKNDLVVKSDFEKLVENIKNNFPMKFDYSQQLWRGSNGLIIDHLSVMSMPIILNILKNANLNK